MGVAGEVFIDDVNEAYAMAHVGDDRDVVEAKYDGVINEFL